MEEDEELLDPRQPSLSRRSRTSLLLLVGLAVVGGLVARSWTRSTPHAAPPASASPATWPSAPSACSGRAALSIVSSTPGVQRTGVTVLLGGDHPRIVEFDTSRQRALAWQPPAQEFVTTFAPGYARTAGCADTSVRILRLGRDGRAAVVAQGVDATFSPDGRAWRLVPPSSQVPFASVTPLDGGHTVQLPAGFVPHAVVGRLIVGNGPVPQSGFTSYGPLLLADATTGLVRANLGVGWPFAIRDGVLIWSDDCGRTSRPCALHRRQLVSGDTRDYVLPHAARPPGAVFSHDGRQLAFALDRSGPDPRYTTLEPFPPGDVAVLHLDTGQLEVVPGIELPARGSPSLAFSKDDRWLMIGLDAGQNTRLLAWHRGLTEPYESARVGTRSLGAPPLTIWPPS